MAISKTISKVVPLVGNWKASKAPFQLSKPDSLGFGLALTGHRASRGVVEASVMLTDASGGTGGVVVGFDAMQKSGVFLAVGGFTAAYSIGRFVLGQGAVALETAGAATGLIAKRWYEIRVRIEGLVLSLEVDGAEVLAHTLGSPLKGDQVGIYGYGTKPVSLKGVRIGADERQAFVVMPFSEPFDSLWKDVIRPVAKKCGFHAYRADDVFKPGVIIEDIVRGLKTADVVIAEVSSHNPNVFYEVGYAHCAGTPLILMAEKKLFEEKRLPFDISGYRCIIYVDAIRGKREVEKALTQYLTNLGGRP